MKKLLIATLACLFVMGFTSQAMAIAIISGSQAFAGSGWSATVNYDVYAPFDATSPLGSIADYSYLYEVINAGGSVALHQFTVGNPYQVLITGAGNQSGVAASPINIFTTSTSYGYTSPELPGGSSSVVYLKSPLPPFTVSGSLQNGGSSNFKPIPGPGVPEPASMALFGMGILGLLGLKKRKS